MFKGFVLSESLKDPTVLNDFNQIKVIVERHKEFTEKQKIWHDFKIKTIKKEIENVTQNLSKQMKKGWYAHFWDSKVVYVVLPKRVFKIPRERRWKSNEYQECRRYALKHGVEERYLDFWIED